MTPRTRTRVLVLGAALIVAAVALTGCSTTSDTAASSTSQPHVSVPAHSVPTPSGTVTPGQPTITGPGQVRTDPPTAPADAEDPISAAQEGAATGAASGFVAAFIDKTATGQAWERRWMPYLTTQAQAAYEGTSQQAVPGTTLTGVVRMEDGGTNGAAVVDVPTDAGTYTVQLNQVDGSWKVLRAILPDSGD